MISKAWILARIAQFREFCHPDSLLMQSIQRGIATLESEALHDIALRDVDKIFNRRELSVLTRV